MVTRLRVHPNLVANIQPFRLHLFTLQYTNHDHYQTNHCKYFHKLTSLPNIQTQSEINHIKKI